MDIKPTRIHDVLIINPHIFGDDRGFFMETYHARVFASNGIDAFFVQDNHSGSKKQTLRGLHYQIRYAQGKLVRVVSGEIFDVAVDLRRSSPFFGQWVGHMLSAENRTQMWIPPGFAHGFYVLSEWTEVVYKASDFYDPECERTLLWNDADLGIEWPLVDGKPPILSKKDADGTPLRLAETYA
ncbi:MAG: dTDP-4-dehydrorhamnose 3,5-epimerase [Anaerolineales bacterium]|nr:dTDP-4-dehydrorhamnose 3,5-epimerase [Anaerolineales bacterium]